MGYYAENSVIFEDLCCVSTAKSVQPLGELPFVTRSPLKTKPFLLTGLWLCEALLRQRCTCCKRANIPPLHY